MKTLLIDILSSLFTIFNNKNFKAFFIPLGFIKKAKKMGINFTNKSFSYSFIRIENIPLNYINFANIIYNTIYINVFTYITINQYLFDKFYKIMIDINIFKYFIIGYK